MSPNEEKMGEGEKRLAGWLPAWWCARAWESQGGAGTFCARVCIMCCANKGVSFEDKETTCI